MIERTYSASVASYTPYYLTRMRTMDQSARYSNLDLKEADLIKGEKHILVAYKMKPKAGHGYLEAAATSQPSLQPVPT